MRYFERYLRPTILNMWTGSTVLSCRGNLMRRKTGERENEPDRTMNQ